MKHFTCSVEGKQMSIGHARFPDVYKINSLWLCWPLLFTACKTSFTLSRSWIMDKYLKWCLPVHNTPPAKQNMLANTNLHVYNTQIRLASSPMEGNLQIIESISPKVSGENSSTHWAIFCNNFFALIQVIWQYR